MHTVPECAPCLLRQVNEAAALATSDPARREQILREAMRMLADRPFDTPPPVIAADIHRMIRERSGTPDPYHKHKAESNARARDCIGQMQERIDNADDPFATAVRLAIAGNIIDFGIPGIERHDTFDAILGDALHARLHGLSPDTLRQAVHSASSILVLGDNCGEIFFDRFLLEQLPAPVQYAVKASPILNDATHEDALYAGIEEYAQIIDNGTDLPGTHLPLCSETFQAAFQSANLIIAKGQGNFETLNTTTHPALFFLLKAKCPVVTRSIGCTLGDLVLLQQGVALDESPPSG